MFEAARRYFETVRHLKAEQVRYRLRPARPYALRESLEVGTLRGPSIRAARPHPSAASAGVLAGEFSFWENVKRLDLTRPWVHHDLGNPWNYPAHYFDYGPVLALRPDLRRSVMELVDRWIDAHPPGTRIAWDPYPTALRIVNWAEMLWLLRDEAPPAWRERVLRSLFGQAEWLSRRLERHLLGTHLLKDLVALLVAATLFDHAAARAWTRVAVPLLWRELAAQVHADGGHIEPSPMYHCMAAADLLDLLNFGAVDGALRDELTSVAMRMVAYARGIETPAGKYPLFGDAWDGGAPTPGELAAYAQRLDLGEVAGVREGLHVFADSGVVAWRSGPAYLVADVGGVGPDHLPGHGHCDSLSFEWYVNGLALIVDSGTFTYVPGPMRQACRGTAAHNTLQVDGREQHEVWAAWRVARRSRVNIEQATPDAIAATLVPWHDRSLRVRRRFAFSGTQARIEDFVEGRDRARVVSRLHLHPECSAVLEGHKLRIERGRVRGAIQIEARDCRIQLLEAASSGSACATEPGRRIPNAVLVLESDGRLPFASAFRLDPAGDRQRGRTTSIRAW
jgi:uncharacterized heparinase superfamily protein